MKQPGRSYEIDMCNGPLAGKLLLFALPLMASGILQLLFNAADVMVVGQFEGKEALAAVGSTTSLVNLTIALFMGLSIGSNVVVARDLGAGKREQVSRGVHTAIFLAGVSGVVLTIFGISMARILLQAMSSPSDVIDLSTLYLRTFFLGMPAAMAYNFGSAMLRAQGDTRRPLQYLMLAGVINVLLNLFFVVILKIGVAGVGLATALSQYVSAGLVLRCLMREEGPLHLELRKLRPDKQITKRIVKIGLPAGFQSVVFSLSNVVVQSTVNSFGSTLMSGSAAANSIEGFVFTAMNSFHQAAINFTGQNYGAGKCKRVDKVVLYCLGFVFLTGLIFGNLVYFFGPTLLGLYAPGEPEAIAQGMVRLGIITRLYFICGMMDVMVGVLRGLGSSVLPMVVSLVGACGLRLVWIYTIFPLNPTPAMLFWSYPLSWLVTALVHGITFYFVRKKAYAVYDGEGPSYSKLEGQHPLPQPVQSK